MTVNVESEQKVRRSILLKIRLFPDALKKDKQTKQTKQKMWQNCPRLEKHNYKNGRNKYP